LLRNFEITLCGLSARSAISAVFGQPRGRYKSLDGFRHAKDVLCPVSSVLDPVHDRAQEVDTETADRFLFHRQGDVRIRDFQWIELLRIILDLHDDLRSLRLERHANRVNTLIFVSMLDRVGDGFFDREPDVMRRGIGDGIFQAESQDSLRESIKLPEVVLDDKFLPDMTQSSPSFTLR